MSPRDAYREALEVAATLLRAEGWRIVKLESYSWSLSGSRCSYDGYDIVDELGAGMSAEPTAHHLKPSSMVEEPE